MINARSQFSWNDEACLYVWQSEHSPYVLAGNLANCVRRAIETAGDDQDPGPVEIVHGRLGLIQIDQIREMAADPSFPALMPDHVTIEDFELGPMG